MGSGLQHLGTLADGVGEGGRRSLQNDLRKPLEEGLG